MIGKLAVVAACAACAAMAAAPERPLQVVTTNSVEFTGGTIRLISTYGQLNIETWDEPRVEVTVTRTAFRHELDKEQEQGKAYLNKIQVDVKKESNGDVEVHTTFPGRGWFARTFHGLGDFNLDYRIKVPKNAKLAIRHGVGDVLVEGVDSDIDATVKSGDIVVQLPASGKFAIDAKTSLGTVYSDFSGKTGQPWLIGQKLDGGSGHSVHLRSGVGGISIQKTE